MIYFSGEEIERKGVNSGKERKRRMGSGLDIVTDTEVESVARCLA